MPTFTDRWISRLGASGKRREIQDSSTPGFGIRISASGEKTWFVRYTLAGERRRDDLGAYPATPLREAREAARAARSAAKSGIDPRALDGESILVRDLVREYLAHRKTVNRPRTLYEVKLKFKNHVLKDWSGRPAASITALDVDVRTQAVLSSSGPTAARHVLSLLSTMFKWAIATGRLPRHHHNPAAGIPAPAPRKTRSRVLNDDELRTFWQDSEALRDIGSIWRLSLLTLCRGGEVRSMRWDEIQEDGRWWLLPEEKMKGKRPHRVFLNDLALEELERCEKRSPWVFPSPMWGKDGHRVRISPVHKNAIGIEQHWVPHDLRRTGATLMARSGVRPHVRSMCLAHKMQGVSWVYDRWTYAPDIEAAFRSLDQLLREILAA